jgi:hypothetical protein
MAMSIFTVSINDPSLAKRSSEVAFIRKAVETALEELGRGNGNVTSGSVIGTDSGGNTNVSLGSWTYTSSASGP